MKTKRNTPVALQEVWEWKEKVYKKLFDKKDRHSQIEKNTDAVIDRLGLKTL
jgi:hypothetical protein